MLPARLEDRAVIALTGPDARPLLQGLVTNDIEALAAGRALYAALLSPQGKILFDFFVAEGEAAILIDVARDAADALAKRLTLYRLRAKVVIERREQLGVYVGLDGRPAARAIRLEDPRLAVLGPRFIAAIAEEPSDIGGADEYHAARIALGVPEGADFGYERIFALDAGLDELHAISFDKGCYVGQELTARMKHRGTARKRILTVTGDGLAPGAALRAGAEDIGEILAVQGGAAFALVRLDRLEASNGAPITVNDAPVRVTRPAWLR